MPDSTPESLISPGDPEAIALRDRVTAVLEILLCSSIPTQLAIGALLRVVGVRSADAAGHLSLTFVVALSLTDTALLIVMMILLMHAHGESARDDMDWTASDVLGVLVRSRCAKRLSGSARCRSCLSASDFS